MTTVSFERVGVLGAGQMGSGIAQVLATAGIHVTLLDVADTALTRARDGIAKSLGKLESKGVIPQGAGDAALGRLALSTSYDALSSADLVIEAVTENESLKTALLAKVDALLPPLGIIASNTSSIPITRLARTTQRPAQVIGMHFMNPVPLMKLVEVIPGMATSAATEARILALCARLGKETTRSQDYPGFVVNRVLMPMINEAFDALLQGVATAEDIDRGMRLGTNQPMGPLALADFIGLDTCLAIMEVIHEGMGEPRYRPSPLLRKYVEAGFLGKKTQRGVYHYD